MTPRTRSRGGRLWYTAAAVLGVVVALLVILWAVGWFGGAAPPETAPGSPAATTQ